MVGESQPVSEPAWVVMTAGSDGSRITVLMKLGCKFVFPLSLSSLPLGGLE